MRKAGLIIVHISAKYSKEKYLILYCAGVHMFMFLVKYLVKKSVNMCMLRISLFVRVSGFCVHLFPHRDDLFTEMIKKTELNWN